MAAAVQPEGSGFGYNTDRGGTNPFDTEGRYRGSRYSYYYIEDRVDLTLCEIKHYLDEENYENDILYKYIKKDSVGGEWIKSFGNFKNYIDYFCFNPFVDKDYIPYDIVKSNFDDDMPEHPIVKDDIKNKNREKSSIFNLNTDELEKMFNNVNYMIKKRSEKMNKMLNSKPVLSD